MKTIHIGKLIKQRRVKIGLTQEELCHGICEASTMSRIENGLQTPTRSKLNALLQRLGLPSEKYYAMMSENELEIEQLKTEIVDCNTRRLYRDGLKKIDELSALVEDDDHLIHQFIVRSRVILGKEENGEIKKYSLEEEMDLLLQAMRLTIADFDMDEIGQHWYSLDEVKIINQLAIVYVENQQAKKALDIFYQLSKYIRKRWVINEDTVSTIIMIAYNHSHTLCKEGRYAEAREIAAWGWDKAVEWGRATNLGGLLYVLGESLYRTGHIEESKDYYIQSYYAFLVMKNIEDANIIRENIQEYFGLLM